MTSTITPQGRTLMTKGRRAALIGENAYGNFVLRKLINFGENGHEQGDCIETKTYKSLNTAKRFADKHLNA